MIIHTNIKWFLIHDKIYCNFHLNIHHIKNQPHIISQKESTAKYLTSSSSSSLSLHRVIWYERVWLFCYVHRLSSRMMDVATHLIVSYLFSFNIILMVIFLPPVDLALIFSLFHFYLTSNEWNARVESLNHFFCTSLLNIFFGEFVGINWERKTKSLKSSDAVIFILFFPLCSVLFLFFAPCVYMMLFISSFIFYIYGQICKVKVIVSLRLH